MSPAAIKWGGLGLTLLILLSAIAMQTYRLMALQTEHAEYIAQIAGERQIAEAVSRQTEQRTQRAIDQVRTDAQTQKAADDTRAAGLAAVGDSLRQQQARLLAERGTLRARLAERGKTIEDLVDLLAELRNEADQHAGHLAAALDASRRAGFACEASYDTLTFNQ